MTTRPAHDLWPGDLPALSVRQAWAGLAATGEKPVENRTWTTPHRGPFWLHAAAAPARPSAEIPPEALRRASAAGPRVWARGAVLALLDLTGIHRDTGCCRPWGQPDQWHWELRPLHLLDDPIPASGGLGLWRPATGPTASAAWPADLHARLAAGQAVVVRLPGRGQPMPPELRDLAAAGLLVRIGRPSLWGNPLKIGVDGDRDVVVDGYRAHLDRHPELLARLPSLVGKVLACHCWPERCHGDVLADLLNAPRLAQGGLPSRSAASTTVRTITTARCSPR